MSAPRTEALFDLADEYESMLNQGISLSGESMLFFLEGRLRHLASRLRSGPAVKRILDFGCGLGHASARLRDLFPGAEVTGVDTAEKALHAARERYGALGIQFQPVPDLAKEESRFDLCYVNGVFHHIPLEQRSGAAALIHRSLRANGVLALFENNPWNFGARLVMSRIPFDRDAHMLSPLEAARLERQAGFGVERIDSLFFFPRPMKVLRFAEPALSWTRLGAQYLVLGVKR